MRKHTCKGFFRLFFSFPLHQSKEYKTALHQSHCLRQNIFIQNQHYWYYEASSRLNGNLYPGGSSNWTSQGEEVSPWWKNDFLRMEHHRSLRLYPATWKLYSLMTSVIFRPNPMTGTRNDQILFFPSSAKVIKFSSREVWMVAGNPSCCEMSIIIISPIEKWESGSKKKKNYY